MRECEICGARIDMLDVALHAHWHEELDQRHAGLVRLTMLENRVKILERCIVRLGPSIKDAVAEEHATTKRILEKK